MISLQGGREGGRGGRRGMGGEGRGGEGREGRREVGRNRENKYRERERTGMRVREQCGEQGRGRIRENLQATKPC